MHAWFFELYWNIPSLFVVEPKNNSIPSQLSWLKTFVSKSSIWRWWSDSLPHALPLPWWRIKAQMKWTKCLVDWGFSSAFPVILVNSKIGARWSFGKSSSKVRTNSIWDDREDTLDSWLVITDYGRNLTISKTPRFARLIRVGAPNRLRGELWETCSGSIYLRFMNQGLYDKLLEENKNKSSLSLEEIEKDLNRWGGNQRRGAMTCLEDLNRCIPLDLYLNIRLIKLLKGSTVFDVFSAHTHGRTLNLDTVKLWTLSHLLSLCKSK